MPAELVGGCLGHAVNGQVEVALAHLWWWPQLRSRTRLRSRSGLARPYIWRLIILMRVDVAFDGSGAVGEG